MSSNPPQNFKNHAKFDPPFHFFIAPVFLITLIIAVVHCVRQPAFDTGWMVVVSAAALFAVFKIRIYSLKVQDRLIRLEERLRLASLLPSDKFDGLEVKQLVALRFASDGEAPALAERALAQNLPPKEIKAAIQSWRPDYFRV